MWLGGSPPVASTRRGLAPSLPKSCRAVLRWPGMHGRWPRHGGGGLCVGSGCCCTPMSWLFPGRGFWVVLGVSWVCAAGAHGTPRRKKRRREGSGAGKGPPHRPQPERSSPPPRDSHFPLTERQNRDRPGFGAARWVPWMIPTEDAGVVPPPDQCSTGTSSACSRWFGTVPAGLLGGAVHAGYSFLTYFAGSCQKVCQELRASW